MKTDVVMWWWDSYTVEKQTGSQLAHKLSNFEPANSSRKVWSLDSNPGPSCCEMTVAHDML